MAFEHALQVLIIPTLEQVETAANDVFTWIIDKHILVRDVSVVVQEAAVVATTTAPVFSLDAVLAGVARAEKATLSVANTTALGTEVTAFESSGVTWTPFFAEEGDTLYFEHKTAAAGGTSAGAVYFILYYEIVSDGNV